jgi:hypothetical protein
VKMRLAEWAQLGPTRKKVIAILSILDSKLY